jgi:hypothetical protein
MRSYTTVVFRVKPKYAAALKQVCDDTLDEFGNTKSVNKLVLTYVLRGLHQDAKGNPGVAKLLEEALNDE